MIAHFNNSKIIEMIAHFNNSKILEMIAHSIQPDKLVTVSLLKSEE